MQELNRCDIRCRVCSKEQQKRVLSQIQHVHIPKRILLDVQKPVSTCFPYITGFTNDLYHQSKYVYYFSPNIFAVDCEGEFSKNTKYVCKTLKEVNYYVKV